MPVLTQGGGLGETSESVQFVGCKFTEREREETEKCVESFNFEQRFGTSKITSGNGVQDSGPSEFPMRTSKSESWSKDCTK